MDNRKETGNGIWNIMQLIGYSNKLTFESNADNIVYKILGGKHGIRECSRSGFRLALVLGVVVLLFVLRLLHLNSRFYRSANNTTRNKMNNTTTIDAMHTHDDMTI